MATYLADKVIVFDGEPAKKAFCTAPEGLISGMNKFLKMMDITFRRDPVNFRPRINKLNSQKDQEQKASGNYFLADADTEEDLKKEEKGESKAKGDAKKEKESKEEKKAEEKKEKPAKEKKQKTKE